MRILISGWFSFEEMGATAGDLLTRDLVCQWLDHADIAFDVALAPPFIGGVDWRVVDPQCYSHVLFVCGPFGNGWPITPFLSRFDGCVLIGLNLSMLESLEAWNPFDLLLERDSSATSRPDMSFLTQQPLVPVVGVVLVDPQKEYKDRALHHKANEAIQRLVDGREMAAVSIDTRLDINRTGLRTPGEIESLIARMDVVLTTRLHGTVLALKNGIPALAIDPIAGGAKILTQAHRIGWPIVFTADLLSEKQLEEAFDYCLTAQARKKAKDCGLEAKKEIGAIRDTLISFLGPS